MDDDYQCKRSKRQMFSLEEDKILSEQVRKHGERDWSIIASKLPGRTARQCRERFKNYLSPNVTHVPWKAEEDNLLRKLVEEIGPKWTKLVEYFPKRTDVLIKNRWSKLHRQDLKFKKSNSCENERVHQKYTPPSESNISQQQEQSSDQPQHPPIQDMIAPFALQQPQEISQQIIQPIYTPIPQPMTTQPIVFQLPLAYQITTPTFLQPTIPMTFIYPSSHQSYIPSYQRSSVNSIHYY